MTDVTLDGKYIISYLLPMCDHSQCHFFGGITTIFTGNAYYGKNDILLIVSFLELKKPITFYIFLKWCVFFFNVYTRFFNRVA
jgi:hypothetical protein